jgi:hypothetical protein
MKCSEFISEAQARRSRHFDMSVENTRDALESQHMVRELGSKATNEYQDMLTRLRLPNFRSGTVDFSHLGIDDIPFIPILEDETLIVSDENLLGTSRQREIITTQYDQDFFEGLGPKDYVTEQYTEKTFLKDTGANVGCEALGGVYGEGEDDLIVRGTPYIIERNKIHITQFPPLLLHELIHVIQQENRPVEPYNERLSRSVRDELEAYRGQVLATSALIMSTGGDTLHMIKHARSYTDYARKVEATRERHADLVDPYLPTGPLVAELIDNKLDITGELELLAAA